MAYDIFHRTLKVIKSLLSDGENHDISSTEIILAIQDLTGTKKGACDGYFPTPGKPTHLPLLDPSACPYTRYGIGTRQKVRSKDDYIHLRSFALC